MRNFSVNMPAAGRILVVTMLVTAALSFAARPAAARAQATSTPTTVGASTSTPVVAGDDASTRTVSRIVAVLVAFAVVLAGLAIWFWRATKPAPDHLDGLDA